MPTEQSSSISKPLKASRRTRQRAQRSAQDTSAVDTAARFGETKAREKGGSTSGAKKAVRTARATRSLRSNAHTQDLLDGLKADRIPDPTPISHSALLHDTKEESRADEEKTNSKAIDVLLPSPPTTSPKPRDTAKRTSPTKQSSSTCKRRRSSEDDHRILYLRSLPLDPTWPDYADAIQAAPTGFTFHETWHYE